MSIVAAPILEGKISGCVDELNKSLLNTFCRRRSTYYGSYTK